jgi:hypothetical protein
MFIFIQLTVSHKQFVDIELYVFRRILCDTQNSIYFTDFFNIDCSLKSEFGAQIYRPVPEIIDPVFAKTSQNARFLLSENERFGLVFVKTGSINSGTGFRENKPRKLVLVVENERFGLVFAKNRARTFKCLWGPGIDSKE